MLSLGKTSDFRGVALQIYLVLLPRHDVKKILTLKDVKKKKEEGVAGKKRIKKSKSWKNVKFVGN